MLRRSITLAVVAATFVIVGAAAQAEEGAFRQRLKERLIERMQEKEPPAATASTTEPITKAGDYYFHIQHDGIVRMYKLHVPRSYNPAKAAPLLVAMHGGGGDMDVQSNDKYYGLISKSEQLGFIVVFPNGFSPMQSGKLATWNAGNCCAHARDQDIDDVGFIRQVYANLTRQMNIDRAHVYATGMSNGGMMSYRLACEAADIFTAIAPVAGTDGTLSCNPSRPVSVTHFHAKNDTHVLFNGGAGEDAFRDTSKVAEFVSVPETISRWVKRNRCEGAPVRVLSVTGAYCDLYSNCAEGTKVQLCVTESGQHSWPGGQKPRHKPSAEDPSQAISANDEMWKFFMSLPQ